MIPALKPNNVEALIDSRNADAMLARATERAMLGAVIDTPTLCDECGSRCTVADVSTSTWTDPDTGVREERVVCVACVEDQARGRQETYCRICDERLRGDEESLCTTCLDVDGDLFDRRDDRNAPYGGVEAY